MEWAVGIPLPERPNAREHVIEAESALGVNKLEDAIEHAEKAMAQAHGATEIGGRARLVLAIASSWLGYHADAQRAAAAERATPAALAADLSAAARECGVELPPRTSEQLLAGRVLDPHAEQRVVQQPPHEKLERQVAHAPHLVALHREACLCPALHDPVARRKHDGLVQVG